MNTILDLKQLDLQISERWDLIIKAPSDDKYIKIVNYLKFLEEQYANGSLGYMLFPYLVVALFSIDAEEYPEIEEVLDLASKLEMPNEEGETNPILRVEENEKLCGLIRNL